ncbi:3-5 exonuclease and kh-i domain-containing protein [Mycena venus]|uniref:3-5 exonuclease and kh-i domain-containing protein n=1 Tax=Mycena venus TaxID=2733690 RepID=A0A8H6XEQ7_9AGAR|nr:3-5 exonuclease and kh-i domain-containing protein [Mycena venus]
MTSTFTLCADSTSLAAALDKLRSSPMLFVDCEGDRLGVAGGSLSLISLRTSATPRMTYIVDVLALSSSDLIAVFAVLEHSSICKVLFDGRMDHSAFFHGHSTVMNNVLDLQLVDVSTRLLRGEGMDNQLGRLSPFFSTTHIIANRANYSKLHRLLSLSKTIKEHKVRNSVWTGGLVDHNGWMDRPLPPVRSERYIDPSLSVRSVKYVQLWSDAAPQPDDTYRLHPILPLEILHTPVDTAQFICTGCRRTLGRSSFPTTSLPKCFVCFAIDAKLESKQSTPLPQPAPETGSSRGWDDIQYREFCGDHPEWPTAYMYETGDFSDWYPEGGIGQR